MNFKEATNDLLTSNDHQKVVAAIDFMHDYYFNVTGLSGSDPEKENLRQTPNGYIVSKYCAAHCLVQHERTKRFARGIYEAAKKKVAEIPAGIRILYGGCGPYASLVTSLTQHFSSNQISLVLLDINEESIDSVTKLYRALNVEDYIEKSMICDCTSEDLSTLGEFDIIITETMSAALKNESQIPITRNLVKYLKPDGIFIPENISISAHLGEDMHIRNLNSSEMLEMGEVLQFKPQTLPSKEKIVQLPYPQTPLNYLYLLTKIVVFENEILELSDSTLTRPILLDKVFGQPEFIQFQYLEDEAPGFAIKYG